jgi:hypothetical protein
LNSDIAAGDVLTLSTSASDGECSDSFTLTILITAPSGDASNTTGGGNNTGGGGDNSGTASDTSCPKLVFGGSNPSILYDASSVAGFNTVLDLTTIWESTNSDLLLYEVTEFINDDEIVSSFVASETLIFYTLSGQPGFADIFIKATSTDGCSDTFMYVIEVEGNNTGGGNNDCTLVFNESYLDDEYGPSLTLYDVDLTLCLSPV